MELHEEIEESGAAAGEHCCLVVSVVVDTCERVAIASAADGQRAFEVEVDEFVRLCCYLIRPGR